MSEWRVGDSFEHPEYGRCTITYIGTKRVGIELSGGRQALLMIDEFAAALAKPAASAPEPPMPSTGTWPDNTFVADTHADRHGLGTHWAPFTENAETILQRLPEWLPQMDLLRAYGDFYKPPRTLPDGWPKGFCLCWPNVHGGIVAAAKATPDTNNIVSLFPYFERGIQTRLRLESVSVWETGLEAQIQAGWGDADIDFFDVAFISNRGWYEADKEFEFILLGIAYKAAPAKTLKLPYTPDLEVTAWQQELARRDGRPEPEVPTELNLSEMAMLIPVEGWDIDDYSFRGPIKQVDVVADMLGEPAWRLVVTVMRFGDEDADLAILVTRRAWQGETPPKRGMHIDGRLWLQGRLWAPSETVRTDAKPPAAPSPAPAPASDADGKAKAESNDDEPTLAASTRAHFDVLDAAFRGLLDELDKDNPQTQMTLSGPDAVAQVSSIMAGYASGVEQLTGLFCGPLAAIAADEGSSPMRVQFTVGRVLEAINELRRWQLGIAGSTLPSEPAALLTGAIDHTLGEVRTWLQGMLVFLADPIATVRQQGQYSGSHADYTSTLKLTPAPQLTQLTGWIRRQAEIETADVDDIDDMPPKPRGGFWSGLGTLAIMAWLGNLLFGNNDDC